MLSSLHLDAYTVRYKQHTQRSNYMYLKGQRYLVSAVIEF